MEFRKAIQQVSKVLSKKKDDPLRLIRLVPSFDDKPAMVYATDGLLGSAVFVDGDLPNALVGSELIVKASKDFKELSVVQAGYGNLELKTETTRYKLQAFDFSKYPMVFNPPEQMIEIPEWESIKPAFHAASKDNPDMSSVLFTPDFVESTDRGRMARVWYKGPWKGFVPAVAFKSWRKGRVDVGFSSASAYFLIGHEEYRICNLTHPTGYPLTNDVIPEVHTGPAVLVEIEQFTNAVKQGTQVSNLGVIRLEFTEDFVHVRAWYEGDVGKSFYAQIPVTHTWDFQKGSVLISGKYLVEMLKLAKTENVKLGFGVEPDHPLRVDAGSFVTCIWQMVVYR